MTDAIENLGPEVRQNLPFGQHSFFQKNSLNFTLRQNNVFWTESASPLQDSFLGVRSPNYRSHRYEFPPEFTIFLILT